MKRESQSSKYIKCRFCNWKIPRFRTNRNGKKSNNYHKLTRHCELCQDDKLQELKLLMYEEDI